MSFDQLFLSNPQVVKAVPEIPRPVKKEQVKKQENRSTNPRKEFMDTFRVTARYHHRYEVFSDFVKLSACALENAFMKSEAIEAEYMATINRYEKADAERMAQLLAWLVMGLEQEMGDVLGSLFMELELGNTTIGQFFSPFNVSELLAGLVAGVAGDRLAELESKPYIMLSEPTCGAGGMVIAFAKQMLERGYNPQTQLRADCVDIDPVAARMCYIQLSLLGIPARVVIGNSLSLKYQREMYTPFWHRVTSKRWPMYQQ
ncbi:N-6 DNA methylase [Serratia plymuthica]|uniref:N-6 DNA methylase n=1 Tax=Serratia plymuthica TaxID=82996 RepID=UPI001EE6C9DF|nr:N-6 DNA methylase [Serratia plymuthica]